MLGTSLLGEGKRLTICLIFVFFIIIIINFNYKNILFPLYYLLSIFWTQVKTVNEKKCFLNQIDFQRLAHGPLV